MRTDVTIDKKQVPLPLGGQIGFMKYKVQFGDIVFFKQDPNNAAVTIGRMIGRIAHAPRIDGDADIRGWIVVAALGSTLSFAMERWVNPADVVACYDPKDLDLSKRLAAFFSESWLHSSTDTIRSKINQGSFFKDCAFLPHQTTT